MRPRRTVPEPFKIKMIEPLRFLTREQRQAALDRAGYNLFALAAEDVTFDFLTDSGSNAMSAAQWGAMMTADESYAGSRSFARFAETVRELTGYAHVIPAHQGRATERLLLSQLVRPGCAIPSNGHFDTTRGNILKLGGEAVDLVTSAGADPRDPSPFKGDIDLPGLDAFCEANRARIPVGMLTITNNNNGGQPVSLANLRAASEIYRRHGIPFVLDACRFAENSYLIQQREAGQQDRSVREIARETFGLADGCLVSAKKDGLVNMGGFIGLRDDAWLPGLREAVILGEGYLTYGGLAARDLEAMAVGLNEVLDEDYLAYRVGMTRYMAEGLGRIGIPTVQPAGGHAVYIDARAFLPHIPHERFPGQALAAELYLSEGIRSVSGATDLVRLAFPRRAYTRSHFDYVLDGLEELVGRKDSVRGLRMTNAPETLRVFNARYEPV